MNSQTDSDSRLEFAILDIEINLLSRDSEFFYQDEDHQEINLLLNRFGYDFYESAV